jgi:hypothetical protein
VIVYGLLAIRLATAADGPPAWAYPLNNPDYKPPVDDGKPVRVPDSKAGYTWSELRDRFIAPVWHPRDHGALPDIVASGRKPGVFACGLCHRATGPGGPENADLAGLPKSYIISTPTSYRVSGARRRPFTGQRPEADRASIGEGVHCTWRCWSQRACEIRGLVFLHEFAAVNH